MGALLATPLLDETASGVTVVSSADVRVDLDLGYATLAALLLALPVLPGLLLEAPLLAWSDRGDRKAPAVASAVLAALCLFAVAGSPSPAWLAVAVFVWGTAAGLTTSLAEASLIDRDPDGADATMTRWTLLAAVGDALAPAIFGALAWVGFGWRGVALTVGLFTLVHAISLASVEWPVRRASDDEDAPEDSVWEALRAALANPRLLGWLLVSATCTLLDEILVLFGSLHLHENLGATAPEIGATWVACALAGAVGAALTERLLPRFGPRIVLAACAALCVVALAGWLTADSVVASAAWLALLGVVDAPLYPLAKARAYAESPDRPGLVGAIDTLFVPVEIVAPVAIGFVAAALGLLPALALLALQPLVVLVALHATRDGIRPYAPPSTSGTRPKRG